MPIWAVGSNDILNFKSKRAISPCSKWGISLPIEGVDVASSEKRRRFFDGGRFLLKN